MISIIVAIQKKDRGLGYQNKLLHRIADDLKRFKKLTDGHPIIMGRKTYDSIGRPLPNRTNIVITRNNDWSQNGVRVVQSIEEAITEAKKIDTEEVFIIGGGQIYDQSINMADRLYLTIIDGNELSDAFFPEYESLFLREVEKSELLTVPDTSITYQYIVLENNNPTV